MVGLARSLAREVASRGITVNVIAPGFIDTDMTSDRGHRRRSGLPRGRRGRLSHGSGHRHRRRSSHGAVIRRLAPRSLASTMAKYDRDRARRDTSRS
jgi:NAD(P)-dependent dehydrogenase (short-subunit alcohol dehydrogenase family)